jgi:hypothetical protein
MRAFIGAAMDSVNRAKLSAEDAVELVARHATKALAAGPLDRDALHAHLRASLPESLLPYCRACDSRHVHPSLLYAVALKGRLALFPRQDGPYVVWRFDRWLASGARGKKRANVARPTAIADAGAALLRRFLSAYGPATAAEFAAWSGTGGGQPRAVWSRVEEELIPVELSSRGKKASRRFLLPGDEGELIAAEHADQKPPIQLLAPGDPLLQLRDRDMLVPDAKMQKVIWKNLSPTGVVLVGPDVAAVVRLQKKKQLLQVNIDALRSFDRPVRAAVEEAADRLAKLRACSKVNVAWRR